MATSPNPHVTCQRLRFRNRTEFPTQIKPKLPLLLLLLLLHLPSSSSLSAINMKAQSSAPSPSFHGASAPPHSHSQQHYHHPYVQHAPADKPSNSPMESILHTLETWTKKAESTANNVWQNLRTSPSVPSAAWGKMNLTAKALSGGGFEALYKQNFATYANEKLKKSFACYLSTSAGPVAGTLYLSDVHLAFCSDSPVSSTSPSGQDSWSFYKVMVPLGKIGTVNPVMLKENSSEKYIQIGTIDGYDFWFMGFVNYDKAVKHLSQAITNFVVPGIAVMPSSSSSSPSPSPSTTS